ncbi:hypothetical protein CFP56_012598, partial [Quercus suber]
MEAMTISLITDSSKTKKSINSSVMDCQNLLQGFEECIVQHTYREGNRVADVHAKMGSYQVDKFFIHYHYAPPNPETSFLLALDNMNGQGERSKLVNPLMVMARALLHLKSTSGFALACASQESQYRVQLPDKSRNARVLVLGGTGRVGGSTATALSKLCPDLQIIIAGRNREKGASMVATLGGRSEFAEVNIDSVKSLEAALRVSLITDSSKTKKSINSSVMDCQNLLQGFEECIVQHTYREGNRVADVHAKMGSYQVDKFFIHYHYAPPNPETSFLLALDNMNEFLRDRSKVQELVQLFDPVVRSVDKVAGERVSMRVDLECSDGRNTVGIFSHRRLSVSVGAATAAFAIAVLEGSTQPGVWFPEEPEGIAIEAREVLLKRAAQGTINFVMNKPSWMVETDPKELGLGIY